MSLLEEHHEQLQISNLISSLGSDPDTEDIYKVSGLFSHCCSQFRIS
jgi:hypothetical protein